MERKVLRIEFILNGKPITCDLFQEMTLASLLRNQLGLTGTKIGCERGNCGACWVIVDDQLVKSCQTKAADVAGKTVTTIEGIHAPDGGPGDIQQAFLRHGTTQCGYCIPAMVLAGEVLLRRNSSPTRAEIKGAIAPVLCRCTGYHQIVDALEEVAHCRQTGRSSRVISAASQYAYIGNPNAPAADGLEKVLGQAKYIGDMQLPGMLYAKVLRSRLPHARIKKLETAPAFSIPGVKAVITSEDFVDHGAFGWPVRDAFVLAYQKVRHVGEPIAAVAAESEAAALEGVKAILLELDPLPVISDPRRALEGSQPIIPENSGLTSNLCVKHVDARPRVCARPRRPHGGSRGHDDLRRSRRCHVAAGPGTGGRPGTEMHHRQRRDHGLRHRVERVSLRSRARDRQGVRRAGGRRSRAALLPDGARRPVLPLAELVRQPQLCDPTHRHADSGHAFRAPAPRALCGFGAVLRRNRRGVRRADLRLSRWRLLR